jgi:PAS domain S-box-containing protein
MAATTLTANVLLVDSDLANLLGLEAILKPLGQNLVRARSGEEALRRLREADFAVVLLDIGLPGLDAFQTAKRLRGQERSRHVPIIFLAPGESMEFPVAGAYRLGAVDYLVKPLVPDILRAKVAVFVELFQRAEQVRQLEHRLREQSERRYRAIIEKSFDAVTLLAADGTIRYASPATTRVLGYVPENLVGRNAFDLIHPDDLPATEELFARLLQIPGSSATDCFRYRHQDGSWRWVEGTGTNLLHEPSVQAVVGNFHDVTERRRAVEGLRRSEQHYRALADSMPVMVFTCVPDGRCDYCNRAWYDYTGLPRGQADGLRWAGVIHPDDQEASRAAWQEAIRTGRPYEDEHRFRRADGVYRWFLCRALPLKDEHKRVVKWFGNCTDIEDQKQARDALAEADKRKDEFLAMLGHELRNPLAPVQNAVHILQLVGRDEPNCRWATEVIGRQVQHLARLVDDLLDVSRVTRGKVELRKEPVELAAVLGRAVETSRPLLDARRHDLAVSLPPGPVRLEADPTRLAQVVSNLLNNAAKYTPEGGRVWLTARTVVSSQRSVVSGQRPAVGQASSLTTDHYPLTTVEVRVRDSGEGISRELLPHVFDLFTQGDRSPARSEGGLGIGLALVKRLVELHGGTVEASSAGPGRGSEFVVRLPALADGSAVADPGPDAGSRRPGGQAGCRVLVVDDNRDSADSIALLLSRWGHDARVAYDGPAALEAARDYRPQLVLLDIGLPGMTGLDVARRLCREPALQGALLVAMTGYGQEEDRRLSEEAGMRGHLVKPVAPEAIQELLDRLTARQGPGSAE